MRYTNPFQYFQRKCSIFVWLFTLGIATSLGPLQKYLAGEELFRTSRRLLGVSAAILIYAIGYSIWNLADKKRREKFLSRKEDLGKYRFLKEKYGNQHPEVVEFRQEQLEERRENAFTHWFIVLIPILIALSNIYTWIN